MRDSTRVGSWLAAAVLLLAPWTVDAAGLGRLTVQSSLGEPFQAEIDLVSVAKDELGTLSVRLAPPTAYQQAGLQYTNIVTGLALRIEKRPNGQAYIKLTSSRPVNEFVVDVLIDLTWSSGRIMREYRVLLDPPGARSAPAVAESRPAPAAVQAPVPAPRVVPVERAASPAAASGSYGPVQRGETLSQIARGVRPDGVSVEQMLVGLYRSNPDAFIRKNMNLIRSGKILRVPEREEIAAIPQQEAIKEYRAQVADWNSYRQKLAASPAPAPEGGSATSGRITARVEDTTSGETRDVVRLSKGEPPGVPAGAKDGREAAAKERLRALEEEIVSREKALKEASERIAQLEKTINDMQRLMEIKSAGMAAAQQKAEGAPKLAEAPTKPMAQPVQAKAPASPLSEAPKPKPAVKPVSVPPLPPEPTLVESLLANPLHLGAIGLVLFGGAAFWLMRRRRAEGSRASALFAPPVSDMAERAESAASVGAAVAANRVPAAAPAPDVDPLDEARIYVSHGRDGQAESILKEALAKHPDREDVHAALLEIYAARKDKAAFAKYAADFQKLKHGAGATWLKVAAMGYALDAANPMYAAGKDVAESSVVQQARPVDMDLDLDLTAGAPAPVDANADAGATTPTRADTQAAPAVPDFSLDVPPAEKPPTRTAAPAADVAPLDFHIDLPPAGGTVTTAKADAFNIDLNLDDKPPEPGAGSGKDAHWYDVQTKFDLAKAYEEMGDRAGAKDILEEVIREGDAEQQAQAQQLLAKLA